MSKSVFNAQGAPPVVPAKVVRWLCSSPEAEPLNGENIEAQPFCHERGLLPGWPGAFWPAEETVIYDLSGYRLSQLSKARPR